MVLHTLYGVFVASIILPRLDPQQRNRAISRWSASLLDLLNIRVVAEGVVPQQVLSNTMFIANHISWVDIHALNSIHTSRFIAKSEIRQWPVFGFFATSVNTLFIDREKRHEAGKIVDTTRKALQAGDCICFFPEGTTTDGTEVKPFKGSLLQAAIEAKSEVRPFSVHYPDAEDGINTEMSYWGEMSLIESIRNVIRQKQATVVLRFAEPINAADYDRRNLTSMTRDIIIGSSNL